MSVGVTREAAIPFYITELQGIKAGIQLPSPFECNNQPKAGRAVQKEA
jgi:hypothetical protein